MVARRRSTGLTKSWNIMTSIICYDLVFHLLVIKSRLKPLGSTRLLYLETLLIRFAITVRDLFKIQSSFLWETQTDSKYSRWGMGGESLALYIIYSGPLTALFGRTKFSLTNRFFTFPIMLILLEKFTVQMSSEESTITSCFSESYSYV